jgi:hypothetical protein
MVTDLSLGAADLPVNQGAIQKIRVKFWDLFRPLPPPVCYSVLFSNTPPHKICVNSKTHPFDHLQIKKNVVDLKKMPFLSVHLDIF